MNKNHLDSITTAKIQQSILLKDLAKTNTIMAGCKVDTDLNNGTMSAAFTTPPTPTKDSYRVSFNSNMVFGRLGSAFTVDQMISVLGVNYHELSHVMYTYEQNPKMQKVLQELLNKYRQSAGFLRYVWNVLEDERIEVLFTTNYRNTVPYFRAMVNKHLIDSLASSPYRLKEKQLAVYASLWVLLLGRSYLDPKIVQGLRHHAVNHHGEKKTKQIEQCVKAYVAMGDRYDYDLGIELVVKLAKLLFDVDLHEEIINVDQHHAETVMWQADAAKQELGGSEDGTDDNDDTEADGGSGSGDADDADDDDTEGGEDGEGSDNTEGGEDGEGSSDSADDADSEGDSATDADAQGGETTDADASTEAGGGVADGESDQDVPVTAQELRDYLNAEKQKLHTHQEVQADYEQKSRRLGKLRDAEYQGLAQWDRVDQSEVTPEMQKNARRLSRAWNKVVVDQDPGRLTHQSSGQVNMRRAMHGQNDLDTVFDQWREGQQDTTDIELVILLDNSGSMIHGHRYNWSQQALWTISRAANLTSDSINVSVIKFDNEAHYIGKRGQRVSPTHYDTVYPMGFTHTIGAVREAQAIFATSTKSKKVFIALTDGRWDDGFGSNEAIEKMNQFGVTTGLCFMATDQEAGLTKQELLSRYYGSVLKPDQQADEAFKELMAHNSQVWGLVHDGAGLAKFIDQIVIHTLKKGGR